MSVIFERRSVRRFLSRPVEPEKLDRIIRAGFEAPSAHNRRPWEFIVITAGEDRQAIAAMSPYAKMLPEAAAAIIPCANLKLGEPGNPHEVGLREAGLLEAGQAAGEKAGRQDVWWVQDLSAATENILLQISGEGLGGVWLGWYPNEGRVKALSSYLNLPPHIVPFSVIALGYPARSPPAGDRFDPSRVHYGAYGKGQG
jgi:nitroreductase